VDICHMYGDIIVNAPTVSARYNNKRAGRILSLAIVRFALVIMHPSLLKTDLQNCKDEDHCEEKEGNGSRISAIIIDDPSLVEKINHCLGVFECGIARVEHSENNIEHL